MGILLELFMANNINEGIKKFFYTKK